MITLYAKKEKTTDNVLLAFYPNTKRRDVVLYNNPECTDVKARIPWHHKNCPRSRRTVVINSFKYNIEWVKQ